MPEINDQYDNDNDYTVPYHWLIDERDFYEGGVEYHGYLKILRELIKEINRGNSQIDHLDVGCGDGKTLDYISEDQNLNSKGIDLSAKAIEFSKIMCKNKDYTFTQQNLFDLNENYQLITAIEVLEHIDLDILDKFVEAIYNRLSAEGTFICTVPSNNFPQVHPGHVQHFSITSLTELLEKHGFKIITIISQHNMNYDFRFSKSRIRRILFKLMRNRFYSVTIFGHFMRKRYYQRWNIVEKEKDAGRIICVTSK